MISQNNLLILGAGQYGVMAAEIADAMGVFGRIAFLDDSFASRHCELSEAISGNTRHPERSEGSSQISLIGTFADLPKFAGEFRYGFVAIGNTALRRKLTEQLQYNCITPAILVHPKAYVSSCAQFQKGCCIEPNASVQAGAVIATSSFIASGAVICHDAFVGEFCHVDCNAVVESFAVVPAETHVACDSVFCKEQGIGVPGHNV